MNSAYTNIQTNAEQTFSSAFSACAQDVEYGSLPPVAAGLHVRWTHREVPASNVSQGCTKACVLYVVCFHVLLSFNLNGGLCMCKLLF